MEILNGQQVPMPENIRLVSWNVNGLRACIANGFFDWFNSFQPDVLALQETRVLVSQLEPAQSEPAGYRSYWYPAQKKGYSGVATFFRQDREPEEVLYGLGAEAFDNEGRVLTTIFGQTALINCYFPNSQPDLGRVGYKLDFNRALHKHAEKLRKKGLTVIICGDFNVAHREIDLANPAANVKNPGFLPEERQWMSEFLDSGYIDTFRHFYPAAREAYTWWTYRFKAREKNIGWRIDYFCVNREACGALTGAQIFGPVRGSDHCPVALDIKL